MKKHFVLLTCLAFALSLLIFQACEKDRLPPVDGTALDYAYACEAVLGPLPEFKYEDAIEIPMTKNGIPLTHGSDNVSDCDQPFAFNAPCDPGNRLGRYQGINPDGTENSDVVFITFFSR